MFKPSNKKMLTVLIAVAMIFSAFAVLSIAAEPAHAIVSSATITYDPTVFSNAGVVTVTYASGGSFTAGGQVNFYLATSTTYSTSDPLIGTFRLPASATSLANPVNLTIPSGTAVGTSYYIIAEDVATTTYELSSSTISVVTLNPTLKLTPSTATAGSVALISGSGWDPSATLTLYLNYEGNSFSPPLTVTLTPSGIIPVTATFTFPIDLPGGSYNLIAQEASGFPNSGITAFSPFTLQPAVSTVSSSTPGAVSSISGAASSTFTLYGFGFPAGATIVPSSTSPSAVTVGGVDAIQSGTKVSPDGAFTLPISGLANAITSVGPKTITVTTSAPTGTFSFPAAIWVSIPGVSPTLLVEDEYTGTSSGNVGDPISIIASGFTSSGYLSVYFDGAVLVSSAHLDSNGFLSTTSTVPYVPAGSYSVFAYDSGGIAASATFTVQLSVTILDSSSSPLNGEYAAYDSTITITATGLKPYQPLDVVDTGLATYTGYSSLITSIALGLYTSYSMIEGSINPTSTAFLANGVGTFEISYEIVYAHLSTGTSESTSLVSLPSGSSIGSATYYAVGMAKASPLASYPASATVTLTFSGLVPYGAPATPETSGYLAPFTLGIVGLSTSSLAYPVVLSNGATSFIDTKSGTATVSFVLSANSIGDGVYALLAFGDSSSPSVVYFDYEFIVSTTSPTSGTVFVNPALTTDLGGSGTSALPFLFYPDPTGQIPYGAQFDLYDFPAGAVVTVTYYTNIGQSTSTFTTDANGAGTYFFAAPNAVGVIPYEITFSAKVGTTAVVITSGTYFYETVPAASFVQAPFVSNFGLPATDYYNTFGVDYVANTTVPVYVNSLLPNTVYNVYLTSTSAGTLGSDIVATFTTDNYGNGQANVVIANGTVGTYDLWVALSTSSSSTLVGTTGVPFPLTIEVTNVMYAFPDEFVSETIPVPAPGTYQISIELNGTTIATFDSTTGKTASISFGFKMPNGVPGNWFLFGVTYAPIEITSTEVDSVSSETFTPTPQPLSGLTASTAASESYTYTITAPASQSFVSEVGLPTVTSTGGTISGVSYSYVFTSNTATVTVDYTITPTGTTATVDFSQPYEVSTPTLISEQTLGKQTSLSIGKVALVSGGGALVVSISSSQIATIVVDVSNAVTASIQVPLSELNATLVAINGTVAKLSTAFGNMVASLKAINATIAGIANGQMIINTTLGKITASLSSLNASIISLSGNVAVINTTLGQVTASLKAINATVSSIMNGQAVIETTLGKITASLSSLNASIVAISHNVVVINTTLGQVKASLTAINGTVSSIMNGQMIINTTLGKITASLSSLNASIISLSGNVAVINTTLGQVT
ncbi:hypothetical protein, partial [Metallosphaera sp.]|uniref:beta strand repeat-containing protein n=1 Tax=Metallosphaera sp. TaxID=2020860 RepID=UPI00317E50AE